MAAMDELGSLLQSLQTLKAPGVTPTKVKAITAICVENIQSEATIIQKILQQFQNSPATHKLGVLYVVDSVTRQWVEKAKAAGQARSPLAASGTYAGGVKRMTEVLPAVMNDLVQHAPDNQKEKITKLLDIWQRGQTFPSDMLVNFKQQVNGGQRIAALAPRSPPKTNGSRQTPYVQTNTQQAAAPVPPPPVAQSPQDPSALLAALSGFGQQNGHTNAAPPGLPFMQNMVPPPPPPGFVPPPPPANSGQPAMPPPPPAGVNDLATQILQAMNAGSIAPDQAIQMMTRPDAVAAKEGMDSLQDPAAQSKARQTRWGVGFGPRDCSDYNTGISVIPISRLTDADRKWALTAEHGGTGGRPLEGGMVLEEPDIEIGAGVSSKAISRRVPTDGGRGGRGGFGGRGGGLDSAQPKVRKQEQRPAHDPRHVSPRADQGVAVPPAVPGFGFQLPGFQAR
ncbi:hypothetical protein N0V94_009212 [Neodidymelliopsis sp. IMI 364377]|nr:hypothetical protein N0V94_009212 [Neodidymelliopsis sp. IMI 364377]